MSNTVASQRQDDLPLLFRQEPDSPLEVASVQNGVSLGAVEESRQNRSSTFTL
jgi:hypothetical protein